MKWSNLCYESTCRLTVPTFLFQLDIMEPKTPEDVYKSHLENVRPQFGNQMDSARQNLAASFVNGFVNTAFGQDKLIMAEGNKWMYKNKEHGMLQLHP